MDMLFINAFLFIKAGSPRPSAAQQGAAVPVCLLREHCDLPVTPALLSLTRGTKKVVGPGQRPAGLTELRAEWGLCWQRGEAGRQGQEETGREFGAPRTALGSGGCPGVAGGVSSHSVHQAQPLQLLPWRKSRLAPWSCSDPRGGSHQSQRGDRAGPSVPSHAALHPRSAHLSNGIRRRTGQGTIYYSAG